MLSERTVNEFLNELASNSPAPGGGSVAALCGALATGLCSMVCNLTIGKKKYIEVSDELKSILEKTESLRTKFTTLIDEDTNAFNMVMAAFKLPKDTPEDQKKRDEAIQEATKKAADIPFEVVKLSAEAISLAKIVAFKGNANSLSDASVGCLLFQTAGAAALYNILINLKSIEDEEYKNKMNNDITYYAKIIEDESNQIKTFIHQKFGN